MSVKDKYTGRSKLEDWNPEGPQSDGSIWTKPKDVLPKDHQHYLHLDSGRRWAECDCGFGGAVYPHNAVYRDGHIYTLEGTRVV